MKKRLMNLIPESFIFSAPKYASVFFAVLLVGTVLRFGLASVNYAANDDHMEVVVAIVDKHRIPAGRELWEAFQPKLYHLTVAALIMVLPKMSELAEIKLGQFVSASAGVLTILLLWSFLQRFQISQSIRIMAFSLAALNPGLIAMSGQATNDAFVILFVSATVFCANRFFSNPRPNTFLLVLIFSILSATSKGNGLVVSIAIVLTLVVSLLLENVNSISSGGQTAWYMFMFLVGFLCTVPTLGGYLSNYKALGSPFAINWSGSFPAPSLIEKTYYGRPGITSVLDGYFTFRFVDLLANPLMTHKKHGYAQHRTSYWTQLYARTYFAHYPSHPKPWVSRSDVVRWLGRIAYAAALMPAFILAAGTLRRWWQTAISIFLPNRSLLNPTEFFYAACSAGYIAFGITYSFIYRDFSVMKAIFCFPGLLVFVLYGARLFDEIYRRGIPGLNRALKISVGLLCILHIIDISLIINRL